MKANESYDDRAILTSVTRATDKDIQSYYDFDLDSLYRLKESKRKKSSHDKSEERIDVNSYIEEQLRLGVPEEVVKQRVKSYLRTANHNRVVTRNNEEKEIFDRLEKRISFEEKAVEVETIATLFKSVPGILPTGMPPESLDTAAEAYALTLLRASEKERARFFSKLDDVLYSRMLMLNAVIIFRKCLDIEITNMIAEHVSRDEIQRKVKLRIEDFQLNKKLSYSNETITRAIVLAKIDNLESGVETYIDEKDYITVFDRLKIIRANVKAERNARRLKMSKENKKQ